MPSAQSVPGRAGGPGQAAHGPGRPVRLPRPGGRLDQFGRGQPGQPVTGPRRRRLPRPPTAPRRSGPDRCRASRPPTSPRRPRVPRRAARRPAARVDHRQRQLTATAHRRQPEGAVRRGPVPHGLGDRLAPRPSATAPWQFAAERLHAGERVEGERQLAECAAARASPAVPAGQRRPTPGHPRGTAPRRRPRQQAELLGAGQAGAEAGSGPAAASALPLRTRRSGRPPGRQAGDRPGRPGPPPPSGAFRAARATVLATSAAVPPGTVSPTREHHRADRVQVGQAGLGGVRTVQLPGRVKQSRGTSPPRVTG